MDGDDGAAFWARVRAGNKEAFDRLFVRCVAELRELAKRSGRQGRGLAQTTSLFDEAYLRLCPREDGARGYENKRHFLGAAARAILEITVDRIRERKTQRRGGDWKRESDDLLDTLVERVERDHIDLEGLALALAAMDASGLALHREIIELYYFTGLTYRAIAELLDIAESTIRAKAEYARAWLRRRLDGEASA